MKHLRIKTKLFQRAALTMLLAVAGITNASARVDFLGHSAINVNGTWYWTDNQNHNWCNGGNFNNANLGTFFANKLRLGGQSQTYEKENDSDNGIDWKSGTVTMYYKIDEGDAGTIDLNYYKFKDNNNYFESRQGDDFAAQEIDISGLGVGEHTLSVWFNCGDKWDSNNSANYNAKFYISNALEATLAPDNNYWATFYCGDSGYKIDDAENACAYTATFSESTITLHNLGKVIPSGTAVIIVGEDNSISMTTTNENVTPMPSNNLHGLDVSMETSDVIGKYSGATTLYMLSNKNNNFGFHDFGGSWVPARKAFLALNESNGSRGFSIEFEDDGTTGLRTIDNGSRDSDSWYSLDGRKYNGKPTAKGVYINNRKKIILK
jgi:type 1 fimbria pilin